MFLWLFADYVDEILSVVYELRQKYPSYSHAEVLVKDIEEATPECLAEGFPRQEKELLLSQRLSRFAK